MAYTTAQLAAIEKAIASGARTVSYDGKTVTYQSLSEMLALRTMIQKELGLLDPRGNVRRTVASYRRGFGA